MVFAHMYNIEGFAEDLRRAFFKMHFPKVDNSVKGSLMYFNAFPNDTTLVGLFNEIHTGATIRKDISNTILDFYAHGEFPFRYPFALSPEIQEDIFAN